MNLAEYKGVYVFAQQVDNEVSSIALELIGKGKDLAKDLGTTVTAVLVGSGVKGLADELGEYGADKVIVIDDPELKDYRTEPYTHALTSVIEKYKPDIFLIGATAIGRDLGPRVCARVHTGLTADCTELLADKREDGSFYIKQNKPSFGENVFVTIVTREGFTPQMMTVRPGVYMPYEGSGLAEVTYLDIPLPESKIEIVEAAPAAMETDSILSAEIVVVGGRGAEEEESFALLKAFAEKLGAAIGGTRPLADTGQIPFDHQIGQTGFTIRPKICISLGVSGAIQHTEGIKDTKLLVAINTDEHAPIYNIADYGMVADLNEVLKEYLTL